MNFAADVVPVDRVPAVPPPSATHERRQVLLEAARAVNEYVRARELRRFAPRVDVAPLPRGSLVDR